MPDKSALHPTLSGLTHTTAKETISLTRKSRGVSMASGLAGKGQVHWEDIMKKFYEANDTQVCKTIPKVLPTIVKGKRMFPTGSTYTGDWNMQGMSGKGVYTFPDTSPYKGITYKGDFEDGMFEGHGELHYDCGAIIQGKWKRGKLIEQKLMFPEGLYYDENNWGYLRFPDRRYTEEIDNFILPAGDSYITSTKPPVEVPPGFYDSGDGLYDPDTKMVYRYDDLTALIRSPCRTEQVWIMANCRDNSDKKLGPCNFLYEEWVEPMLETEDTPVSLIRTKTFNEEFAEERDVMCFGKGKKSSTTGSRASSRYSYIPLFAHSLGHRRFTENEGDNRDFYIPPDNASQTSRTSTVSLRPGASMSSLRSRMSRTSRQSEMKQSRQLSRVSYVHDALSHVDSDAALDDEYDHDFSAMMPKGRPPPNW